MLKKSLSILKIVFFFALGFALIWFSVKDLTAVERANIIESFKNANYWWVALALFLGILSHIARALRWVILIEAAGYHPSVKKTFFAVMIGYLFNLAFPRLGEVSRCGIMNQYEKVPFTTALGTVVSERALDMLTFGGLFVLTIFLEYHRLGGYLNEKIFPGFVDKANGLASYGIWFWLGIIAFIVVLFVLVYKIRHHLKKVSLISKIFDITKSFLKGIHALVKIKKPLKFIFYTLFIWAMYFLMVYLIFRCFPETQSLSLNAGLAALTIGSIAIMVTPGGIGLYPIVISGLLILYGVPSTLGFALGWVAWTTQTVMILVGGSLSYLFLFLTTHNKKPQDEPLNKH